MLSSALKHSLSQPNSKIYTNHTISQRGWGELNYGYQASWDDQQ